MISIFILLLITLGYAIAAAITDGVGRALGAASYWDGYDRPSWFGLVVLWPLTAVVWSLVVFIQACSNVPYRITKHIVSRREKT